MDFTEYDEARLIQLAQSGSDGAIAELDARYRGMLVGFATAAIGNHADADEVAQSTLTKAFVRIDQFEAGTSFRSWLLQVARNTLADWHRTSARYRSAITSKREVEAMPQTPPAEIGIFEYAAPAQADPPTCEGRRCNAKSCDCGRRRRFFRASGDAKVG